MRSRLGLLMLLGMLAGLLAGCGGTPTPTWVPPTQTPWIIVVTATPNPKEVAQATPTPRIVIVTATLGAPQPAGPTPTKVLNTPTPTKKAAPTATATPSLTATGQPTLKATAAPTTAVPTGLTATGQPPTATATIPPPTATMTQPTATSTAPRPTSRATATPVSGPLIYPAPVLIDPPDGKRIIWKEAAVFAWSPVGALAGNEYYRIHIDRPAVPGLPAYGDSFFVKDAEFVWLGSAKDPFHPPQDWGDANATWQVWVTRVIGVDQNGKNLFVDLSLPSELRTIILEAKTGP